MILGLGNLLLADEGVGIHALHNLKNKIDWELLDGGTQGISLLPYLDDVQKLIIVDAVNLGGKPGEVYLLRTEEVLAIERAELMTVHEIGLRDLLSLLLLQVKPEQLWIVGVETAKIEWSTELSLNLKEALPEVCAKIIELAHLLDRSSR